LFVLLDHPDGYQSLYGHASRLLVAVGDSVRAGQVVALSGSTGRSTGPHLHFEVRVGGRAVDPRTVVREE
jgi:murein DD-endopeptidase MepM/ murein hydrolase activator NlpD